MSFTVNLLNQVASKCESFAITLLDKCTTKHEIQTLLQTKCVQPQLYFLCFMNVSPVPRSYRGHHDANFNVAILDGHKEIVAHEKFQQLLHKKWGQRDKIHYGDDIRCLVTLSPWTFAVSQASIFDLTTSRHVDVEYYSQVQHLLERDEQGAEVGSCDKTGF